MAVSTYLAALRKIVGGLLLHQGNRGFQAALIESNRVQKN